MLENLYDESMISRNSSMNVQLVESIVQLIEALPQEEKIWIQKRLAQQQSSRDSRVVDLNQFSGVIQLQQDPLEYQRQSRDE